MPELGADSFFLCVCVYGMCTSVGLFKTELRNVVYPQARKLGCLTAGRHVSEPPDVILCLTLNPTTKVLSTINNTIYDHSEAWRIESSFVKRSACQFAKLHVRSVPEVF